MHSLHSSPTRNRPACSVVIPTLNCLDYLPTALATVELQDTADVEAIVVDDGSTDGTAQWLTAAAPRAYSLRVLSTEGIGPSRARNAAISAARGELIAFLDADDQWWPGKLARQLAFHRDHPRVAFSFTDYIHMTPDGRTHGTCFEYWKCPWTSTNGCYAVLPEAESRLLATNAVGTSTVVARRDALERIGGFSPDCRSAEDWDLWLRLSASYPVACSGAVTMTYLMRPSSETASRGRRIEAMAEIVDRYAQRDEPQMRLAVSIARARLETARAEALSLAGRNSAAAAAHVRALAKAPSLRGLKAATSATFGILADALPPIGRRA